MALNVERLTLGEVAKIEELSGMSIDSIGEEGSPKGKMLAALAFVAKRRSGDPKFTWNQAMGLSFDEANEILGLDEEPEGGDESSDPTSPEDASAPSKSGSKPKRNAKPEAPQE